MQRRYEEALLKRLHPNSANVRLHSKQQIGKLVRDFKGIGFLSPIITDDNLNILAGHARWAAANELALKKVPIIRVSGLSEAQCRAFMLADNRLGEDAGWDKPALAIELTALAPLLEEAGLTIELTGFEPFEVDRLLEDHVDPEADPLDDIPSLRTVAITRPGDLWRLGPHRLLCGDSTKLAAFQRLMAGTSAAMVITDAPYNLSIRSIQGRGRTKHREFAEASGEMTRQEFTRFLTKACSLSAEYSHKGSIHFLFMDWRHQREILDAGEKVYGPLKSLIVWVKTNAGQGSFYRSQHELIFIFKNGDEPHLNNFGLGQHGRHRSNVWTYAGVNTFRKGRTDDLSLHPTVKPVALVADAMRDCSRRGDIVLDPFLGSGTTVLAAQRVGRKAYGIEIDPLYVDAAILRWQAFTKADAVLDATGQTFHEVSGERSPDAGDERSQ